MQAQEFYREASQYVADKAGVNQAEVSPNIDLFANGLVDSLLVTEFILFVEDLTGRPIDIDGFRVEYFATLETIYEHYVAEPGTRI